MPATIACGQRQSRRDPTLRRCEELTGPHFSDKQIRMGAEFIGKNICKFFYQ
jgi:hypothetical protein